MSRPSALAIHRWTRRRWVAWAAHLALLLAVCTPVVSRLLMPVGMAGMAHATATAMSPGMPMAADMQHGAPGAMPAASWPDGHSPLDACAYCSFFMHMPLVFALALALALLPVLPSRRPVLWRVTPSQAPIRLAFRSRGPPRLVSIV